MSSSQWFPTSDLVPGDVIAFSEGVFEGPHNAPRLKGRRRIVAQVLREFISAGNTQLQVVLRVVSCTGESALEKESEIRRHTSTILSSKPIRALWRNELTRDEAKAARSPSQPPPKRPERVRIGLHRVV